MNVSLLSTNKWQNTNALHHLAKKTSKRVAAVCEREIEQNISIGFGALHFWVIQEPFSASHEVQLDVADQSPFASREK